MSLLNSYLSLRIFFVRFQEKINCIFVLCVMTHNNRINTILRIYPLYQDINKTKYIILPVFIVLRINKKKEG